MIYRRNGDGPEFESISFGGGRIVVSEGSSGAVVKLGESGIEVAERNDYYAFGGRWEVSSAAIFDNCFRFSGKEDQTTGELPYQDFGARFLRKKLPIWTSLDPLAEKCPSISSYAYSMNNPI